MVSVGQLVSIIGLLLVCCVIYTQQAAISTSSLDQQRTFEKRRIDAQSRASIPLFRGSNLGIFVRKRLGALSPEHPAVRKKDLRSLTSDDDNDWAKLSYDDGHLQRRYDDYSENPGPMFGR